MRRPLHDRVDRKRPGLATVSDADSRGSESDSGSDGDDLGRGMDLAVPRLPVHRAPVKRMGSVAQALAQSMAESDASRAAGAKREAVSGSAFGGDLEW